MTETQELTDGYLNAKRRELVNRREQQIHQFSQAARAVDEGQTANLFTHIGLTNEFITTLDRIDAELRQAPRTAAAGPRRYRVSSLFLHDCFKKLTADRNEQLIFITGAEVDNVFVLDQCLELEHDRRDVVGVVANQKVSHRVLIMLEKFGHRLLGHFHSHPGTGSDATKPSGTDENFQRRLESAGHIAVAAIFSRDGYLRFLRLDGNFEVEIFGEGVERHEANVYRLTNLD
jgi:hypothetical protein